MLKQFNVDIWNLVDVSHLNAELDEALEGETYMPVDIAYRFMGIDEKGNLTIEATFTPEEI
jgi:hypothetical protein